jgi:NAD(P)-dependent dehydrogenase (short-subunit alcohol dehydrogenase family)
MGTLDLFRLDGKRALVTGASRGLGRSMALALADAGADIVITGRTQDTLDKTAGDVRARGREAWTVKADMAVPAECQKACERVVDEMGPIDILINNVGNREVSMSIEAEPLETWQRQMDLNLTSCFLGTKIVGGAMRARHGRPHHQHRADQCADRQPRHRRARLRDREGGRAAFHALRGGRLGTVRNHGQRHLSRPVHDRHQQGLEREAS